MELLLALNGDCTLDVLLEPEKLATLYLGAGTVEVSGIALSHGWIKIARVMLRHLFSASSH